jgi:predicted DsbA family dithiol-disulfide isomerase
MRHLIAGSEARSRRRATEGECLLRVFVCGRDLSWFLRPHMKVEIWSDVMCPFCYIGKRKFEAALAQFPGKEQVEIEWKSFQLNPELKTETGKSINEYLSEVKGWTVEQARIANERVTSLARAVGIPFNLDRAIVANSFDAHRLSHMAREAGLQDQMEERLFAAYFTEGKNTADHATLVQLGTEVGLDAELVRQMLESGKYASNVEADVELAAQFGIRGVPFFVLDRKFGVSGAQETGTFLEVLTRAAAG